MKKLLHTLVSIIILIILFGIFTKQNTTDSNTGNIKENKITESEAPKEEIKKVDTFTLIAGNLNKKLEIKDGQTLYEILKTAQEANILSFSGKNYSGLGFYATNIGQLNASGGKNLFYYINGVEASIGISSYLPRNGDIIEWKLK